MLAVFAVMLLCALTIRCSKDHISDDTWMATPHAWMVGRVVDTEPAIQPVAVFSVADTAGRAQRELTQRAKILGTSPGT
jgi:hypothetical protein